MWSTKRLLSTESEVWSCPRIKTNKIKNLIKFLGFVSKRMKVSLIYRQLRAAIN